MKKCAAKVSLICLEIMAVILAVAGAGAAFLYWRLEQQPVSLALLKPSVELSISRQLPQGYAAKIRRMELMRESRGQYAVRLGGVRILDQEKIDAAYVESASLSFGAGDIFSGRIGPKSIRAEGAEFRIVRNESRRVEIPAAKRRERSSPFAALSPILEGRLLESAFENADINNAAITFLDEASGRSWVSNDATVSIRRTETGLSASASGAIDMDGAPAGLNASAQYTEGSGVISVDLDGEDFPIGDILTTFYGDSAAIIDAPVTGKAVISLTSDGEVLSSRFAAEINEGELRIGGGRQEINFIRWDASFDPEKNQFDIEHIDFDAGGNKGSVTGSVGVAFADDVRNPESVSFDLKGVDLTANAPGFLQEALPISSAALSGAYRVSDKKVALHNIDFSLLEVAIKGSVSMAFPDDVSPEVNVNIAVDGALDPQRLLRIWPLGVAMGARDWIDARMEAAVIDNIRAEMMLPAGAVGDDGMIPDDAMNVTFDVAEGKAYYVQQMSPLTNASGQGRLRGNSFMLKVDRASIGPIALSNGEVDFPEFMPKWQPTYMRFTADGRSEDILALLDQEPLRLLSKIELQPEQFQGDANARVEIMRPNKRDVPSEEYRYSGKATFENMDIASLVGDVDLTNAEGVVDLKARSMTVTADASLSEAPIKITWRQNFYEQDGASSFSASGTLDSSTGDLFGVSSRQFLRGPVDFVANAKGELGALESLDVSADFSAAALTVDVLDWSKPMGAPANGSIKIDLSPEETMIREFHLEGEGVSLAGNLTFGRGGALKQAHIPRLIFENAADLAVTARRNQANELVVTAVGEYLRAGPLITSFVDGANNDANSDGSFGWGPGLSLTARIDRMTMREGVDYNVASLDLWRDAERLQALEFRAFDHDGPPLTVSMAHTGEEAGPSQVITAQSGAIGALLRGVFGLTSINGGNGEMKINLGAPGEKGFSGELEARDLKVMEAPLLARIFSAGSLDGLANLLNGEGIDLSYAYGAFDFSEGVLSINDMRATGPSVGITADGAFAMGEGGEISLNGAVAPIYQINSILGNAPIIGDILVGKKGEGIVALSYSVSGERAAPAVFVNPLSALTPGIFRRLFDPQLTPPDVEGGFVEPVAEEETSE